MEPNSSVKISILKAAQKVFSRYGYKKTNLEDIAKIIGKGKSHHRQHEGF
ncbi:MAG: TetR family transcriptional regulator [Bacteroidales bacterium]|jgi:AcrR family transcriptional regulator|nr:TetR family transcriptional regulator [Bacteroidales bacterium]